MGHAQLVIGVSLAESSSDLVRDLIAHTEAGYHSRIRYDKGDGKLPTDRVIEPRRLVDGSAELLVRALQLQPDKGVRTFKASRIVDVKRHELPLSANQRKSNTFCTGEVVPFRPSEAEGDAESRIVASPQVTASRGARWNSPWFNAYASALRDALLDGQLETYEELALYQMHTELRLTREQIDSVHVYILGEEMLAASLDGWIEAEERERLSAVRGVLGRLGSTWLLDC